MALNIERIETALSAVSNLIPLLPLVYGWRRRPVLWWCALLSILSDTFTLGLQYAHVHYQWVGNCFFAAEFVLISTYYKRRLPPAVPSQVILALCLAGYVWYTFWQGVNVLNLSGAAVFCVVYMVYTLVDFYGILRQPSRVLYLEQSQGFWVNVAILFYAAATCLLFLFYQDILAANPVNRRYWVSFFLSMNIFKYLLIATALRAKHA